MHYGDRKQNVINCLENTEFQGEKNHPTGDIKVSYMSLG